MKKSDLRVCYALISGAKLTKLDDAGKIKVMRAYRKMRPAAEEINHFIEETAKKMQGDEHAAMEEKSEQWKREGADTSLTIEERMAINAYFEAYNRRVDECLAEPLAEEFEADWEALTEDELLTLAAGNDWTPAALDVLEKVLCG